MVMACSTQGKEKCAQMFLGTSEGSRLVAKSRYMCEVRKVGLGGIYWIHLAQDSAQWRALVNTVMKLRDQYNFGKFLSNLEPGDFSMELV
jgi:hypothetical protein